MMVALMKKLSVLIVDDSELNRLLLARMMHKLGFDVALAGNGKECLAKLQMAGADLVLLDLVMPVLSGFEAISILRKLEATSNGVRVPVVACTAESLKEPWQGLGGDETLHSTCLAMGFDAAVGKPVTASLMSDLLQQLIPQYVPSPQCNTPDLEAEAPVLCQLQMRLATRDSPSQAQMPRELSASQGHPSSSEHAKCPSPVHKYSSASKCCAAENAETPIQDMQAWEVDTAASSAFGKYCCCQKSAMKLAVPQWSPVASTAHNWVETPCWPPTKPHP